MRVLSADTIRCYLGGLVVALAACAGGLRADEPAKPGKADQPAAPEAKKPETLAQLQKKITFEMRDKPWSQVLEWLGDQSGMPVITGENKPTGTLSFVAPKV